MPIALVFVGLFFVVVWRFFFALASVVQVGLPVALIFVWLSLGVGPGTALGIGASTWRAAASLVRLARPLHFPERSMEPSVQPHSAPPSCS